MIVEPDDWELGTWRQERGVQRSYFTALMVLAILLVVVAVVSLVFLHELVIPLLRGLSSMIGPLND